jgi:hypothetical protein
MLETQLLKTIEEYNDERIQHLGIRLKNLKLSFDV